MGIGMRAVWAALIVAGSVGLAACSKTDSSSDSAEAADDLPATTVDLGGGTTVDFEKGEPLKVIYVGFGAGFTYTDAQYAGAEETAKKLGIELDVADPGGDPAKQVQQTQDAIQSGKYNAAIITPIDANQFCSLATKQMPAAGMMAVLTISPICERASKVGEKTWAPGTLSYVGGTALFDAFKRWADRMVADNPGPQRVIAAVGPPANAVHDNLLAALRQASKENPEFEIVAEVETNLTTPDAQKKVQDALQANPDATMIATQYSEITKGAIVALEQANRLRDVKVYDIGGDSSILKLIEKGKVALTYPYYPYSAVKAAVEQLHAARQDKRVDRYVGNDGHPVEEMRPPGDEQLFITKENVAEFIASKQSEY